MCLLFSEPFLGNKKNAEHNLWPTIFLLSERVSFTFATGDPWSSSHDQYTD